MITRDFSGCQFAILRGTFLPTATATDRRLSQQSTGATVRRSSIRAAPFPRLSSSFRPYPPLMSPVHPSVMYSPPLEGYPPNSSPWYPPPSSTSQSAMPILMPMSNSDQMQLQHRLSVNVTDHYEWTTHPTHFPQGGYSGAATTTNSSNFDTMSLNGSLSSGTSTNDSSPYPLLTPMPTVYFNQYPSAPTPSAEQQQFFPPAVFYPSAMSPRPIHDSGQQPTMLSDPSSAKFVVRTLSPSALSVSFRFLPGQGPFLVMVSCTSSFLSLCSSVCLIEVAASSNADAVTCLHGSSQSSLSFSHSTLLDSISSLTTDVSLHVSLIAPDPSSRRSESALPDVGQSSWLDSFPFSTVSLNCRCSRVCLGVFILVSVVKSVTLVY